MKKLYLIHTIGNYRELIYDPFAKPFSEQYPDVELYNISDDSLLKDTLNAGKLTPAVASRILSYAQAAEASGADAVMVTCTSVNEAAAYARKFMKIPVFNIDEPLVKLAVNAGKKIGILATLPTSPIAINHLLMGEAARQGKDVETTMRVVEGAFDVLCAGDRTRHDEMVNAGLKKLAAEVDAVIFAQISMSLLPYEDPGVPVFKIGPSGFEEAARLLNLK